MKLDIVKKFADSSLNRQGNQACISFFHQPKMPNGVKEKFQKKMK